MSRKYKVIGKNEPVVGRMDRANGRFKFVTDMKLPGMLVGKLLRSPLPHAIIKNIDVSRARRLPGVECAICWKDVRKKRYGFCVEDARRSPSAQHGLAPEADVAGPAFAPSAGATPSRSEHRPIFPCS